MANGNLGKLLDHLDQLLAEPDERLLTRFLATRDEAAFSALVRRHGPMVLGVCRRLLRHQQDAEDCFQATFIILARRASAVVKRASLGSWLYGVAYRTALQARCVNARRQTLEKQVDQMPHPTVAPEELQDWRTLLDEELNRLPEKYKAAVVLCDLEDRPRKDAAHLLGIPEGTLSSRLATARKLLAGRLSARGVTISAVTLTTALSGSAASATVPAPLVAATCKAAALAAAGQLAATACTAAALTHEVMKAMFMTKLKAAVAGLVIAVVLTATGIATQMASGPVAQAQPPATGGKPADELEALRRENALLKLNLRVTLEKLEALEEALKRRNAQASVDERVLADWLKAANKTLGAGDQMRLWGHTSKLKPQAIAEIEDALKLLKAARDEAEYRKAVQQLEEVLRKIGPVTKPAPKEGSTELPPAK